MTLYRIVGPGGNAAIIEADDLVDLILRDWTKKVACTISGCHHAFGYTLEAHDNGKIKVYVPEKIAEETLRTSQ